jgi:hypothetical protein
VKRGGSLQSVCRERGVLFKRTVKGLYTEESFDKYDDYKTIDGESTNNEKGKPKGIDD